MSVAVSEMDNLYIPQQGRILEMRSLTAREKYFKLELERPLNHGPGQFVMLSVPGVGESAISITSGPREDNILEMVIRKAGSVTQVLHGMAEGDYIGVRGPFGSGFPLERFRGKDLLIFAGGLGLVPLRSLIQPVMASHGDYGRIRIIAGFRNPSETLFLEELRTWRKLDNVEVHITVDRTEHMPWEEQVGLVTQPIADLQIDGENTIAILCGPPVMYKFVLMELASYHYIPNENIFVDLERRMKCGVGKCGHCQINQVYCCQEGPVFRFSDVVNYPEALE